MMPKDVFMVFDHHHRPGEIMEQIFDINLYYIFWKLKVEMPKDEFMIFNNYLKYISTIFFEYHSTMTIGSVGIVTMT